MTEIAPVQPAFFLCVGERLCECVCMEGGEKAERGEGWKERQMRRKGRSMHMYGSNTCG